MEKIKMYKMPTIITIFIASTFILSILYEFAFFHFLDISMVKANITINDFFRESINFMPLVVALLMLIILVEVKKDKNNSKKIWNIISWITFLIVLVGYLFYWVKELLFVTVLFMYADVRTVMNLSHVLTFRRVVVFIVLLFFSVFLYSNREIADIKNKNKKDTLILMNDDVLESKILRVLDRGIYILKDNKVVFIYHHSIKSIRNNISAKIN